ncbi:hypothetical protein D8B45_08315, partial [Candidatus Gracilibacteria bacterium]
TSSALLRRDFHALAFLVGPSLCSAIIEQWLAMGTDSSHQIQGHPHNPQSITKSDAFFKLKRKKRNTIALVF